MRDPSKKDEILGSGLGLKLGNGVKLKGEETEEKDDEVRSEV